MSAVLLADSSVAMKVIAFLLLFGALPAVVVMGRATKAQMRAQPSGGGAVAGSSAGGLVRLTLLLAAGVGIVIAAVALWKG